MLGRIFRTERLVLRPWQDSDATDLYELARDERVGLPCGWQPHQSLEESRQIIMDILSAEGTYAIVEQISQQVVGAFSLRDGQASKFVTDNEREREVGFWLGVPYWERGYIPEVLVTAINYLFNETAITTLWAGYFDGNNKSKRVQEKCGFQFVETHEKHYVKPLDKVVVLHVTQLKKA